MAARELDEAEHGAVPAYEDRVAVCLAGGECPLRDLTGKLKVAPVSGHEREAARAALLDRARFLRVGQRNVEAPGANLEPGEEHK